MAVGIGLTVHPTLLAALEEEDVAAEDNIVM